MERLKRLQSHYGLSPDGILGPVTLTALEKAAGLDPPWSLKVSRKSISMIVRLEIGSAAYYRRELMNPTWPGGASGVTIGVGYDLGYRTWLQIDSDWGKHVPSWELEELSASAGFTGDEAENRLGGIRMLRRMEIPLEAAREVFYRRTLPEYAKKTRRAFPGVEFLPADAQGALLSLVYNRGTSMIGARRREMYEIKEWLRNQDGGFALILNLVGSEIRAMKRLWVGKNLAGLMKRREKEALLVEGSDREYGPEELVEL